MNLELNFFIELYDLSQNICFRYMIELFIYLQNKAFKPDLMNSFRQNYVDSNKLGTFANEVDLFIWSNCKPFSLTPIKNSVQRYLQF